LCLRENPRCEGRAEATAREGFILREGADGESSEGDVGEHRSESVIPVMFACDGLECVYVKYDLTFIEVEVDAGP